MDIDFISTNNAVCSSGRSVNHSGLEVPKISSIENNMMCLEPETTNDCFKLDDEPNLLHGKMIVSTNIHVELVVIEFQVHEA